ncbi:matrixin family metalloprotease [Oceanibacterium hippocampi]|uniref:Matrixin n=1 Tax=Oceanibacterium hippocampi TaxID=745714 RepID=A0A1Y5SXF6_9PROT|nr:matrixin family metalloprotease [Oceanibacterium hippocampi]SLN49074.1 Matrixin [Oceanibacterium hippocampi]
MRIPVTVVALLAVLLPGIMSAAVARDRYQLLSLNGSLVKWGAPALKSGATVSYAFAASAMHFPTARNCRAIDAMTSLFDDPAISPEVLDRETAAAFAMWEQAADIRFVRTDDATKAGIVIGVQAVPRGIAYADVDYRRDQDGGIRAIRQSRICLNPERTWKIGFDGDRTIYDLRYALAHEIGHAIGLDHAGPSGQLMSFRYTELFRGLQPGDIAGAAALYGAADPTVVAAPAGAGPAASVERLPADVPAVERPLTRMN